MESDGAVIAALPKSWPFSELPGCREPSQPFATYSGFSYDSLPPISAQADDQFHWLQQEPTKTEWSLRDWNGEVQRELTSIEKANEVRLPPPFVLFLRSLDLQSRVRSCTACYLQMPDAIPPVVGTDGGHVIHFLSDQQWCLHWSLYVNRAGDECVICSEEAFGFEDEADNPSAPIDLLKSGAAYCAPSFVEFLYRFWIENEIWYGVTGNAALTAPQHAYLEHYKKQIKGV